MNNETSLPNHYNHPIAENLYYEMVLVKKGLFIMGSGEGSTGFGEKPEHWVRLTQSYYIGKYPVTQAVWSAIMDGHNPSYFKGQNRPVEKVSWLDIVEGGQDEAVPEAFLKRLNQNYSIKNDLLTNFRFRLPTEAEWEYAAKGGHKRSLQKVESRLKSVDIYTSYGGGDKLKQLGWYNHNSHSETKEIGQKQPNELGIYDMSGNVYEWVHDWYGSDYYQHCRNEDIVNNPKGPSSGRSRVLRGGAWFSYAGGCRVSNRFSWHPTDRIDGVGFRLVLAPSSAEATNSPSGME